MLIDGGSLNTLKNNHNAVMTLFLFRYCRGNSMTGPNHIIILNEFDSHLWDAANILRDILVNQTDWKIHNLPFLFLKRVCDVYNEETTEVVEDRAKAALTDSFEQVKNENAPIIFELFSLMAGKEPLKEFEMSRKHCVKPLFVIACILTMIYSIKPTNILSNTIEEE